MLLAAGLGTRLHPLTADRAKPAVPFLGKPLIAGLVELLARHGFERCVVNTHHLPESIRSALADPPLEVAFSHEREILGTAGCLAKAAADGLLDRDRPTLIVNAKLYTDIDLSAVMRAHRASGARVTMVLKPNLEREEFREVRIEGDRVIGFGKSKVPEGPSPLLFTGIHVIEPEVLAEARPVFSDTVTDLYPKYIDARLVLGHVDRSGRWWEFSTLARYLELHRRAAEEGLGPSVVCSRGAIVEPGAAIDRAVVWEDARVQAGAFVQDAVIGRGVRIGTGERVERSAVVQIEGKRVTVPIPS
jgi:NDP-sugar pyrophosphorylase family protein